MMSVSLDFPVYSGDCIALMVLMLVVVFQERISLVSILGFFVEEVGIAMVMN